MVLGGAVVVELLQHLPGPGVAGVVHEGEVVGVVQGDLVLVAFPLQARDIVVGQALQLLPGHGEVILDLVEVFAEGEFQVHQPVLEPLTSARAWRAPGAGRCA